MTHPLRHGEPPLGWPSRIGTHYAVKPAGEDIVEITMSPAIDTTDIAPGTHLVTPRFGYTHHGIYAGDGKVIHYGGLSRSLRRAPVETITFGEFAAGRPVRLVPEPGACYFGVEVVRRAASRLGEDRYRLTTNNCEHFCAWCCRGVSRSAQIDRWTGRLCGVWPRGVRSAAAVA
jgi:hypothetical protein